MDNSKQYIREGQKVTFSAQLEKGDRRLTSWIVYEGNQCDDNHIVKEEKQVGTEFSFTFEEAGEYTIVGYGKRDEINKSTATKVQVGKPVLEGIKCVERANTYFKNNVYIVKKGTKVTFRLKFKDNILPTSDKLLHLVKVIPIGGTSSGKIIREGKENEYSYNAINRSSYTVIAKFGNRTFEFSMRVVENFEEEVKKFEESIAKNSSTEITTIPSGIENVRSKDSLKLNFNPKLCFIAGETEINPSNLVWKLNGNTLLAKGTQIEIPREQIANCKKNNKVEVFKNNTSTKSIASYNFSVVKNEIIKFDVSETPKFGKKVTFKVKEDKKYMIFPKLEINEEIYWEVKKGSIFVARGTGLTFEHKFNEEGDFQVRCYISNVVIEEEYNNIKQPKILPNTAKWIDKDGASGNILKKAGYYQEVCAYIEHQELVGEKVSLFIYEKGTNQLIHTEKEFTIKNKKNICIPFTLKKPTVVKDVMQVYFRIKPINSELDIKNIKNQTEEYLTVVNRGDVVDAYFCDANDTKICRAIEVGTVDLHFKLYMTNMLEKEVEILFYILWDKYPNTTPMKDCLNWVHWEMIAGHFSKKQPFHTTKAKVNNKGEILVEVPTLKLMQIDKYESIVAVFKIMGSDGKVKGAYLESEKSLRLLPNYSLPFMKENLSAVKVLLKKVNNKVLRQEIGEDENIINVKIYNTGQIDKIVIKEKTEKLRYIYYVNNKEYVLGVVNIIKSKVWKEKGLITDEDCYLVKMEDLLSFKDANIKFKYKFSGTTRRYINPDCFACLLGAMLEVGYEDFTITGFSNKNGDPGISTTHINGRAGDILYLNTNFENTTTYLEDTNFDYDREVKFIEALYKFGWGKEKGRPLLSEKFQRLIRREKVINPKTKKEEIKEIKEETLLPHTTPYKKWDEEKKRWTVRHNHHLHLNGLKPNYK